MTMEGACEINAEAAGDLLVFYLKGKLDALSSPQVEKKISHSIDLGHTKVILDFSEVDYLSSAGLRILLSLSKKIKTLSGRIVLTSLQENVIMVIKMTGCDQLLDIAGTKDEALKKLTSQTVQPI